MGMKNGWRRRVISLSIYIYTPAQISEWLALQQVTNRLKTVLYLYLANNAQAQRNDEAMERLMAFNDGFRTSLHMVNPSPFASVAVCSTRKTS
jgi:hypothetical protein